MHVKGGGGGGVEKDRKTEREWEREGGREGGRKNADINNYNLYKY